MNINAPFKNNIPALRNLWREAFGDTEEFVNRFFSTGFRADCCRIVTVNDDVAAALYWFDCLYMGSPIAYLYAIATMKAYQGQGLCHKLMADTHRHLSMLGYEGAILVPGSKELFLLYKRMGYQTCSHIGEFCCDGTNTTIKLHRIDKAEYARLRRKFLPEGSVVQEGRNLDFLQTQASFYTGPGFLLAAHTDADTLYGIELLGDTGFASGIINALGYRKGVFRTPGNDMPFAMFRPLVKDTLIPPTYFGLAFD